MARKLYEFGEGFDKVKQNAIAARRLADAEIIDPADIPTLGHFEAVEGIVLRYELTADMNAYLVRLGPTTPVRSLEEIIECDEKNWRSEMPIFGQYRFLKAVSYGPLTGLAYLAALEESHRVTRIGGNDAVMDRFRLDANMAPTTGPDWLTHLVNRGHEAGQSSQPAAASAYPNTNVPAGYVFGLPVGISFFGPAYSEPTLIKLAYAFEQITHHRRPAQFLPTAELTV